MTDGAQLLDENTVINKEKVDTLCNVFEKFLGGELTNRFMGRGSPASEIGMEECHASNIKAVTDTGIGLIYRKLQDDNENAGRNRLHFDLAVLDSRNHANDINVLFKRALTNGITSDAVANFINLDHWHAGFDRFWNIDEVNWLVLAALRIPVFQDAILYAVVKVVAQSADITDDATIKATVEKLKA
jgi:hypothetical protein